MTLLVSVRFLGTYKCDEIDWNVCIHIKNVPEQAIIIEIMRGDQTGSTHSGPITVPKNPFWLTGHYDRFSLFSNCNDQKYTCKLP